MQGDHFPVGLGDGVQLLCQLLLEVGVLGDAQQGGACAGQAEACAGGAHQGFDLLEVGDQVLAVILVVERLRYF